MTSSILQSVCCLRILAIPSTRGANCLHNHAFFRRFNLWHRAYPKMRAVWEFWLSRLPGVPLVCIIMHFLRRFNLWHRTYSKMCAVWEFWLSRLPGVPIVCIIMDFFKEILPLISSLSRNVRCLRILAILSTRGANCLHNHAFLRRSNLWHRAYSKMCAVWEFWLSCLPGVPMVSIIMQFLGDLTFDIEPTPKCALSVNFGYPVYHVESGIGTMEIRWDF